MSLDQFKEAIDSLVDYPKMTGFQGGDPLLHPDFAKMCEYARSKIKPEQLGLWTTLPVGMEHYREDICATFGHIFINDHTRPDIYHQPVLVAAEDAIKDEHLMWQAIDNCWAQMSWSASIFPTGAWFCEIAGSMSMLFGEGEGWRVEPGWWWRIPADFREQMDMFCRRCGFPLRTRRRCSQDGIDDMSQSNYDRLKDVSKKIKRDKFEIYDFDRNDKETAALCDAPLARYKDTAWRNKLAHRYGMYVVVNEKRFWTPYLLKDWEPGQGSECNPAVPVMSLIEKYWPTGDTP